MKWDFVKVKGWSKAGSKQCLYTRIAFEDFFGASIVKPQHDQHAISLANFYFSAFLFKIIDCEPHSVPQSEIQIQPTVNMKKADGLPQEHEPQLMSIVLLNMVLYIQ